MLIDILRSRPRLYRLAKRVQPTYFKWLETRASTLRAVTARSGMTRFVQNPLRTASAYVMSTSPADSERAGMRAAYLHPDVGACRTLPAGLDDNARRVFEDVQHAQSNAGAVFQFVDGRAWGADGAILTRDRQLVADLSPAIRLSPEAHPAFQRPIFGRPRRIDGRVAVLTGPSPDNLSHWLFGVLPRTSLLVEWNPGFQGIDWVLSPPISTSFQAECLKRYGVPRSKLVQVHAASFIEAPEIVAPSFISPAHVATSWFLDDLRRRFDDVAPATGSPRIWVSRANAPGRRITNESAMDAVIADYGLTTVHLERLPFIEQVALFKGADIVVAPHGAGLSQLAFARPGTGVVELFSAAYVNAMYWCVADQVGLRYRCCVGKSSSHSMRRDLVREDLTVDVDAIRSALDDLVSGR